MAKIKIKDLPEDQKITKEEMAQIMGGILSSRFKLYSPTLFGPGFGGAAAPTDCGTGYTDYSDWSNSGSTGGVRTR